MLKFSLRETETGARLKRRGISARLLKYARREGEFLLITREIYESKVVSPPSPGLGDAVAAVATPIARALKLSCIDPATKQLRPESGCAQRKAALNRLTQS